MFPGCPTLDARITLGAPVSPSELRLMLNGLPGAFTSLLTIFLGHLSEVLPLSVIDIRTIIMVSQTALSSRTFCCNGYVLCLYGPLRWPLTMCGC